MLRAIIFSYKEQVSQDIVKMQYKKISTTKYLKEIASI